MITAIIIYVVLCIVFYIVLDKTPTKTIDKFVEEANRIPLAIVLVSSLLLCPIVLLVTFYNWNFIEPEQYGTKQ